MFGNSGLHPSIPLRMVLTTLFLMLLLSASVTALGALFLSRDLDLILSSPITRKAFLGGKIGEVILASSWMFVLFGLPTLLAFGAFFKANTAYYLVSPLLCAALLLIPSVASILIATLFGAVVPPNRGREVFLMLFLLSLGLFFFYLGAPQPAISMSTDTSALASFGRFSEVSAVPWAPSSICAEALSDLIAGRYRSSLVAILLFAFASLGIGVLALWAMELFFERAYTQAQSQRSTLRINSRLSHTLSAFLLPFMRPAHRAILEKEFKLFSRDIAHTVQLGMLLGICFVYLYNFRMLRNPDNLAPEFIKWWHAFLMLCNVALSSMVVTSICTRFVFPSVSLEGASFWVLQCSPVTMIEVLRTKFRAWFVPLAAISSVIFVSGALALNADGPLVLGTCVAGVILCYGLVALSIGLGAIFSQFDWEYSAQVSTTLGSFILMFASVLVLLVDMVPIGLMFASYGLLPEYSVGGDSRHWLVMISCLIMLFFINRLLASWSLSAGARSLQPR
jgi:ABC-2 type transport system permease protein